MSTIDLPPVGSQDDTIIFEKEMDLKIPKLVPEDHELESLRYELENLNSANDRLQKKLEVAVEYSNNQTILVEQLRKELSEVSELKIYLGQATERNNMLDLKLTKGREVIEGLLEESHKNEDLTEQYEHIAKTNISLDTALEGNKQEVSALKADVSKLQDSNTKLEQELKEEKNLLEDRDKELGKQSLSYAALQSEFNSRGDELKALQTEIGQAKDTLGQLEIAVKQHAVAESKQLQQIDTQQQKLKTEKENAVVLANKIQNQEKELAELNKLPLKIKEREKQLIALDKTLNKERDRIKPLETEVENARTLMRGLQEKINEANQRIPALEKNISIRDDEIVLFRNKISEQQNTISTLEATLKQRDNNVASLEQVLNKAKQQVAPLRSDLIAQESRIHALETLLQDAKKVVAITTDKANSSSIHPSDDKSLKSYGLKKPTRPPDDLKLISGVGEALEKTLHNCGIYYFEQIAGFTQQDIADVNNMLNFKGRIDRDEWVKQARLLMHSGITPPTPNKKNG